ncbi:MAG: Metal dependent phosphohydrolase [Candidatus Woesebacteria bacterium GW2011_GWB1_38_5b]|uniref:Metal dependent phosphohydrolase n=1 Tax=Candidatus Woesebacteria bacterium GW2011_GWB1_38_5b TaxID=1618569 RepID=A0A0G0K8M4_9BACT|nr:MAG: Metal dependent phosphohydrolase [Candidatus Woesebacteria bacterium GW2011_GWB1_38_5b]KKQ76867.1 MAG: Metal dependent phosphohydrolase [Parcubacteria group bacterium GW2011_GWA1_38_7]
MKPQPSEINIHVPSHGNEILEKAIKMVNANKELLTLWKINNVNAIERLQMSDHGIVHFQIVANIALRMTRILLKNNIELSVTKNYGLSHKYAELIVFLGSIMHDLGISVHRDGHEEFSLFIANNILRESLTFLSIEERTIVISETLHTITSHRRAGRPLTLEAGIVRVADALDMSKGRSRIPYEAGIVDIHSVSAAGIESVEIAEGIKKPIQINILMNNSAGLFQVDDLLKNKLGGSGIEKHVAVKAYIEGETEKKLMKEYQVGNE